MEFVGVRVYHLLLVRVRICVLNQSQYQYWYVLVQYVGF